MKRIHWEIALLAAGALGIASALSGAIVRHEAHGVTERASASEYRNGWILERRNDDTLVATPVAAVFSEEEQKPVDELLVLTVTPGWQAEVETDGSLLVYEGKSGDASSGDESVPGSRVIRFRRDGSFTLAPPGAQIVALYDRG